MEGDGFDARKWEDLDLDVLVTIFQKFNILELTSGIGHVCKSWRYAVCDPLLWKTLDFSMLTSNFIKIPLEPYVYVDRRSDKQLTKLLKIALNLSCGNATMMPAWNRIKETGICKAISMWKDLESLTMPSIADPSCFMEEISKHCKKFSELKIMGVCDIEFVQSLVQYVPNLKVLSLRCSILYKDALLLVLNGLMNLEVLNISHSLIVEGPPPPAPIKVVEELDESILEKGSRLREFLTCMNDSCIMCQRMKMDEGLMRWYRYEKGLWKEDEVSSLAI
ncbi:F-box domain, cyclin-like protein [Cynara cardunculus var. scolymus]|uniref:F-box domain, cyclin-like protein n=1 Tax=Cynara cardunculus var. scolymus TaxID=59895 RepID=A0A118K655_CYNCS|nr:F-box domain, cyclin-like protein [Cynara cardunculus var. scolymus]